jgi:hypothetical protein
MEFLSVDLTLSSFAVVRAFALVYIAFGDMNEERVFGVVWGGGCCVGCGVGSW